MCGIAGIVGADSVRGRRLAESLAPLLAHRGPDGKGVETVATGAGGRGVTLVHQRLAIVPEPAIWNPPTSRSSHAPLLPSTILPRPNGRS